MSTRHGRFTTVVAAALAALALGTGAAAAGDLRSWDQKYSGGSRFVVLSDFNDLAVLDKETQIVWQRQPFGFSYSWDTAGYACEASSTGGRRGWRLPTIYELTSLQNPSANPLNGALPSGHPFLHVSRNHHFWSATAIPFSDGTSRRLITEFNTAGTTLADSDSESHEIWCVRGGAGDRN